MSIDTLCAEFFQFPEDPPKVLLCVVKVTDVLARTQLPIFDLSTIDAFGPEYSEPPKGIELANKNGLAGWLI